MPAYVIADVTVSDAPGFEEYRKGVPGSLAKYGGRFVVRGGRFEVLEGGWRPTRLVIVEVPPMEHARRWYDSPEYRPLRELRVRTAKTDFVLVDGV